MATSVHTTENDNDDQAEVIYLTNTKQHQLPNKSLEQSYDHDNSRLEEENFPMISKWKLIGTQRQTYASRRDIEYDDSNSDSGEEDFDWVKDSEQYVNTDGFDVKVRAN